MTWLDDPIAAALALPPLVLVLFVFASALLEYVFPPYWGDTFVLLGFFLAGQGAAPPAMIFAAAAAGSVAGSIAAYQIGRRYGLAITRRISPRRRPSRRRVRMLSSGSASGCCSSTASCPWCGGCWSTPRGRCSSASGR